MYVCICNRYRDTEISAVAQSGVRCARRAYHALGNGPNCGRCLDTAQALIDRIHSEGAIEAPCAAAAVA
jgi:bacterioferritin-associated ferredoxin